MMARLTRGGLMRMELAKVGAARVGFAGVRSRSGRSPESKRGDLNGLGAGLRRGGLR